MLERSLPFLVRRAQAVAMAALLWFACGANAQAALLNIAPPSPPTPRTDIYTNFAYVAYFSGTSQFFVYGNPATIDYDNLGSPDFDLVFDDDNFVLPEFSLNILVDNSGDLIGGTGGDDLVITGAIDLDASFDMNGAETFDTLLTAEVVDFGYEDASPYLLFDMVFSVTGGTQAAAYGGIGGQVGVILNAVNWNNAFNGSFAADFENGGLGTVDAFGQVPEPTGFLLLAIGGIPLLARRTWKVRRGS